MLLIDVYVYNKKIVFELFLRAEREKRGKNLSLRGQDYALSEKQNLDRFYNSSIDVLKINIFIP